MERSDYGDTISRAAAGAGSFDCVCNCRSQGDEKIDRKPGKQAACC